VILFTQRIGLTKSLSRFACMGFACTRGILAFQAGMIFTFRNGACENKIRYGESGKKFRYGKY
jgi:hypothetical protein